MSVLRLHQSQVGHRIPPKEGRVRPFAGAGQDTDAGVAEMIDQYSSQFPQIVDLIDESRCTEGQDDATRKAMRKQLNMIQDKLIYIIDVLERSCEKSKNEKICEFSREYLDLWKATQNYISNCDGKDRRTL